MERSQGTAGVHTSTVGAGIPPPLPAPATVPEGGCFWPRLMQSLFPSRPETGSFFSFVILIPTFIHLLRWILDVIQAVCGL